MKMKGFIAWGSEKVYCGLKIMDIFMNDLNDRIKGVSYIC